MQDLQQQEWREQLAAAPDAVIIDVRTPGEIAEGYIPNALHINIMDAASFMREVEQIDKDKPCFVYCKAGGRSKQACMIMESIGFRDTRNLVGGFSVWNGERTL